MIDVKKKLSSFLPSSARAQLQNVLTVEWDTHKTVLVQVPGSGVDTGPTEMEMGGMDRNAKRDNYGRLADDDEESEGLFNGSGYDAIHSNQTHSDPSSSSSYPKPEKKRAPPPLAPRPAFYNPAENPFDETSPSYLASENQDIYFGSEYGRRMPGTPEQKKKQSSTWTSFGEGETTRAGGVAGKQYQGGSSTNPWGKGGEWSLTPSPTSSRGTRESDNYDGQDPFR